MKKGVRLLALGMILSVLAAMFGGTAAFALDDEGSYQDDKENTFLYKKLSGNKAALTGYQSGDNNSSVTIPERLGPLTVTQIGDGDSHVFPDDITSVTLPKGAVTIADSAFEGTEIKTVQMNSGLTEIGESAFADCPELTTASIPPTVKRIKDHAFDGCGKITSVTLGSDLTSIGKAAFKDCAEITQVTLPTGLKSIGGEAFSGCLKLKTITIPSSVTSIGTDAFLNEDKSPDGSLGENPDLEIKGYKNSTADRYASKNKIYFTSIGTYVNKTLSVSTSQITVSTGGTGTLTVNGPSSVTVSSDNDSIARVTASGGLITVTGIAAGSTQITVDGGDYGTAQVSVTVTPPKGGSIPLTLDTSSVALAEKDTYYVLAKTNAVTQPSASSSVPSVATVTFKEARPSEGGYIYEVTGVKAGDAVLTFVSGNDTVKLSVNVSAYGSGTVSCDTTVNFPKKKGEIYTFKMTVTGTNAKPSFTVGNGGVLKTYAQKKVGNVYYFQIIATGKPGDSTGVYTTLPGQNAVKHCAVWISQ